ncbi:MAG: polysaccharide deacetylase family protein [Thermomicrobiales bacterium]
MRHWVRVGRRDSGRRHLSWLLAVLVMAPMLAACGGREDADEAFVPWGGESAVAPTLPPATPAEHAPAPVGGTPQAVAVTVAPTSPTTPVHGLTDAERLALQPNELGFVPVMQYHVITTDPALEADPFVRTAENMRKDLQFLSDQGFFVISMREFLANEIAAPAGKKPVLLTFDDATASQFRWIEDAVGKRTIDPDTALGVLEAFFAAHPDFGKGGMFAILPHNCFADDTPGNTMADCDAKLDWLANNGYEVANHTMTHANLDDVTDEQFMEEVGGMEIWLQEHVSGPGLLRGVLVMPFGMYPDRDLHPGQRAMMRDGFTYQGQHIVINGAFLVGANPTESPNSAEYDHIFIARIQANAESLDLWFPMFEDGGVSLYVSDGDPMTISVPDPLPADLEGKLDPEAIVAGGRILLRYDAETGAMVSGS